MAPNISPFSLNVARDYDARPISAVINAVTYLLDKQTTWTKLPRELDIFIDVNPAAMSQISTTVFDLLELTGKELDEITIRKIKSLAGHQKLFFGRKKENHNIGVLCTRTLPL